MINLGKRLEAVAKLVGKREAAADIGCDHGRLSVSLLQKGQVAHIYAVDISAESLGKAVRLAALCGVGARLTALCGDGLSALPAPAAAANPPPPDLAVIAGVGGKKIIEMLSDPRRADGIKRFVLQPMRNVPEVERFLKTHDYQIIDKLVVEDGKKYVILYAAARAGT